MSPLHKVSTWSCFTTYQYVKATNDLPSPPRDEWASSVTCANYTSRPCFLALQRLCRWKSNLDAALNFALRALRKMLPIIGAGSGKSRSHTQTNPQTNPHTHYHLRHAILATDFPSSHDDTQHHRSRRLVQPQPWRSVGRNSTLVNLYGQSVWPAFHPASQLASCR